MQQGFDGTSGYFNDVPYFSPVETTVFYEAVQSCRLHKLPGRLMVSPRSMSFFVKSDTELSNIFDRVFETTTGTQTKSAAAVFPDFKSDFSSTPPIFKKSGGSFLTVREAFLLIDGDALNDDVDTVAIKAVNATTVNQVWSNLFLFLHGVPGASCKFRIEYTDISLAQPNGCGECCLSLLLAGIASILHFFAQKDHHQAALENISIEFIVLNTAEGACAADRLYFYAENKLKISVTRLGSDSFSSSYAKLISQAQCVQCCEADWLEKVCAEVVDAHELLCDAGVEHCADKFESPVILLIVPRVATVRAVLACQILDSYSSEPLRVQSECEWTLDALAKPSPVVFFCSAAWLVDQMNLTEEENLVRRLKIKVVIHGGFCETANTVVEDIARCAIAVRNCGAREYETRIIQFEAPSFASGDPQPGPLETEAAVQASGSILLLLFRRFVMRFSPSTKQPFATVTREVFCSQRSYVFFCTTVRTLTAAGIVASRSDISPDVLELSTLGRFLSLQYRIDGLKTRRTSLSLSDGKAVLWAFLLRQPLVVPQEIVKRCHTFHTWVDYAITEFCNDYRLTFDFQDSAVRTALVEQLARFGFRDGGAQNRVHYLLSSPTGTRFPLRPHLTGLIPTICRGWYEQAPLNAGLALEKKEVNVSCLPPKATYCEMEAVETSSHLRLQCPLELSYPVIIAHSVLHISLHNICVFSETAEPSALVPLPISLLESGVIQLLTNGEVTANAGLWLDGVMNEITPATSDSSVLAPLALKGKQHIQCCEREVFTRRKKRRATEAEKASRADVFHGVLPRTAAERSAVEELVELIKSIGREKAEKVFRGKKGFNFLEVSHELHPYYLYSLGR
ncbi:hypothetical protein N2W54_002814 [Lotmaria passim]